MLLPVNYLTQYPSKVFWFTTSFPSDAPILETLNPLVIVALS